MDRHHYSLHLDSYQTVISDLKDKGSIYPCNCSRKSLLSASVYPQTCRYTKNTIVSPFSLRIKSTDTEISFKDELQGTHHYNFAQQHGDFIIKRKDNITAYQLAVVIDDYKQNISHVLRGFDLLDSTAKQLYLQQSLGYPSPKYCHVPIVIDSHGQKLSKQSAAQAVSIENPSASLYTLLTLLKQNPIDQLKKSAVNEIINWAIANWKPEALKNTHEIN